MQKGRLLSRASEQTGGRSRPRRRAGVEKTWEGAGILGRATVVRKEVPTDGGKLSIKHDALARRSPLMGPESDWPGAAICYPLVVWWSSEQG